MNLQGKSKKFHISLHILFMQEYVRGHCLSQKARELLQERSYPKGWVLEGAPAVLLHSGHEILSFPYRGTT